MMTITPRSAHSHSRVPAPDAGDGEPLTVGVGAALVGVAVAVAEGGLVAGVVAVTDGWTVVGAAVGLLGATLALLSGDVPTPPDGDNLPLIPLACAHPAAMLAAARSAMSSSSDRRNRRAHVSITPALTGSVPARGHPVKPRGGPDWFRGRPADRRRMRKSITPVR